jgi:hypothetical protein
MPSIIYTIGAGTITTTVTGQPAYEGVEDAYIGIRNDAGSGVTLTSLNLAGPAGFTGFDGDGIGVSPNPTSGLGGAPGGPFGPTGYEGPATFYTNVTSSSVTVNFSDTTGSGLPPGKQTYFSFELPPSSLSLLITVPPPNQTSVEGASHLFNLGAFTASGAGPWTVDVNWGDGTAHTIFSQASPGTITPQSHTYAEEGPDTVTVKVTNPGGQSSSANFAVTVTDPAVVATGVPVGAVEGAAFTGRAVATFTDPGGPRR